MRCMGRKRDGDTELEARLAYMLRRSTKINHDQRARVKV